MPTAGSRSSPRATWLSSPLPKHPLCGCRRRECVSAPCPAPLKSPPSPSFSSVCGSLSSQNPIFPKSKRWRPNSRVFRRLKRTNKFVFSSEFKPLNTPGFPAIQRLKYLVSYFSQHLDKRCKLFMDEVSSTIAAQSTYVLSVGVWLQ